MARGYDYLGFGGLFLGGDRLDVFAYSRLPIKYEKKEFIVYRYIPYISYYNSIKHMIKLIKLGNDEVMKDLALAFAWGETIAGEQYWHSMSKCRKNDYFHTLFLQIYCMSMR